MRPSLIKRVAVAVVLSLSAVGGSAGDSAAMPVTPLPDMGMSLLRVAGALAFVLALFFGGVWLFRNWQRLAVPRGRAPKLAVLEVRSLGNRHALYVVAYEEQRLLLSASPGGVTLLTPLSNAPAAEPSVGPANLPEQPSFSSILGKVLSNR